MKKFLIYCLKVLVLALLLAELVSFVLVSKLAHSNFYKPGVAWRQKGKSYDYIVLGSSRGLTGIDTKQLDTLLGTSGYNFGIDDTGVETHELMLKHLLACGVTFRSVIINYDGESDSGMTIGGNDHRFLPFIDKDYVYDYFKKRREVGGGKYLASRYFPFIGLGYFNVELLWPSLIAAIKKNYYYRSDAFGDYGYPPIQSEELGQIEKTNSILNLENSYLGSIRRICQEHGIKLVIYYAPEYNSKVTLPAGASLKPGESFVNYSDFISDTTLFYDHFHVNTNGRSVVTAELAKSIGPFIKGQ